MPTTNIAPISAEQYRALQRPVVLPIPGELFDFIVERLKTKFEGTDVFSYAHADPFRSSAGELTNQLFLLMPPQPKTLLTDRGVLDQMVSLIEVGGKKGVNHLNPKDLSDITEAADGATLLTDIEDGKLRLNVKPSVSRENIKKKGRHSYTTWRGIIHAIVFPEVFQDHNMDLVGSRCGSGGTPRLFLHGGRPKLYAYWVGRCQSGVGRAVMRECPWRLMLGTLDPFGLLAWGSGSVRPGASSCGEQAYGFAPRFYYV